MTHLPYRTWCEICVKAKAKHSPSRALSERQPIIQCDYAFMNDENSPTDQQATILTLVDCLTGLGMACVTPFKGKSLYAKAEIKKILYECGRTFGVLQYDQNLL